MNLHDLLFVPAKLKAGETRNIDGQLAICISTNTNLGPLWAIENRMAKFSTHDVAAYIIGVCCKIDARHGLVTMTVVKGLSGTAYKTGTTHVLPLASFGRYFILSPDYEAAIRNWMADQQSEA